MRRAARRDENHGTIRAVFEGLDCSILDVASCPCGFDLIVGYKTQAVAVEVKDGAKPPSARKLTENEFSAHLNWRGPKAIVTNNEEAAAVVALLRRRHFAVMEGAAADFLGA
jgi:hypothetical protein